MKFHHAALGPNTESSRSGHAIAPPCVPARRLADSPRIAEPDLDAFRALGAVADNDKERTFGTASSVADNSNQRQRGKSAESEHKNQGDSGNADSVGDNDNQRQRGKSAEPNEEKASDNSNGLSIDQPEAA